jgi:CCR4-NOT transcription complex subunit 2
MVKQPVSESSAFTMSSEDFPALPGTTPAVTTNSEPSGKITPSNSQPLESEQQQRVNNLIVDKSPVKRGIVTSPDGEFFFSNHTFLLMLALQVNK